MKKTSTWALLLAVLWTAGACNYFPDDQQPPLASLTSYDAATDFSQYGTFAINATIGNLHLDDRGDLVVRYQNGRENGVIINAVADKLIYYCGYTRITNNPLVPPHLLVDVLYMDSIPAPALYTRWWAHYTYWNNDKDNWYFRYVPYYPQETLPHPAGTLIIDIKDLKNADVTHTAPEPVKAVWVGAVRGLLPNTRNDTEINDAITDCFTQTTAFKK